MVAGRSLPVAIMLRRDLGQVVELLTVHLGSRDMAAGRGYNARGARLDCDAGGHVLIRRVHEMQRQVDPVLYRQCNIIMWLCNGFKQHRKPVT